MAGYIAEFFGYAASDKSQSALATAARKKLSFSWFFLCKNALKR